MDIEGKPDPVSEITAVTVLVIKSRAAPQEMTEIAKVRPLEPLTTTAHYSTYYNVSSCTGGLWFCNTRTVTGLAATSTSGISAAKGHKRDILDNVPRRSKCH